MASKTWFSDMGNRVGNGLKKRTLVFESEKKHRSLFRLSQKSTLGILAFETAKIMSRLVSLHKSLSDDEVSKLRKETVRLEGVSYLISKDEDFLLKLACMEKMEELDRVGIVVARLGKHCSEPDFSNFDRIYTDMKLGLFDLTLFSEPKTAEKTIGKLEKFVSTTSELYTGLESLAEMEITERKIKHWKYSGPMPAQKGKDAAPRANCDLFDSKLSWQKQQVKHLRQVSLWGQTFNKTVRLMARAVCVVYARLSLVFSPYIVKPPRHNRVASQPDIQSHHIDKLEKGVPLHSKSGPIPGTNFHSRNHVGFGGSKLAQQAGPSTTGGSGLALRYANVVLLVDRYLKSWCSYEEIGIGREDLYHMLPRSIKRLVKSKFKKLTPKEVVQGDGWREEMTKILGWLAPMAQNTVRWQMERNVEKQNFDPKPKVLLLQTLYFADREKAETAIAEILVGLCCICKYENHRSCKS